MENWSSIAAEVASAIASVGFVATLTRASAAANEPQIPWANPASPVNAPAVFSITVIDEGIKSFYHAGLVVRTARVLMLEAGVVVPTQADQITVRGVTHQIQRVNPFAPAGVDLYYKVEIAA